MHTLKKSINDKLRERDGDFELFEGVKIEGDN